MNTLHKMLDIKGTTLQLNKETIGFLLQEGFQYDSTNETFSFTHQLNGNHTLLIKVFERGAWVVSVYIYNEQKEPVFINFDNFDGNHFTHWNKTHPSYSFMQTYEEKLDRLQEELQKL